METIKQVMDHKLRLDKIKVAREANNEYDNRIVLPR